MTQPPTRSELKKISQIETFVSVIRRLHDGAWILPHLLDELLGNMSIQFFCRMYGLSVKNVVVEPRRNVRIYADDGTFTVKALDPKVVWEFTTNPHVELSQDEF